MSKQWDITFTMETYDSRGCVDGAHLIDTEVNIKFGDDERGEPNIKEFKIISQENSVDISDGFSAEEVWGFYEDWCDEHCEDHLDF